MSYHSYRHPRRKLSIPDSAWILMMNCGQNSPRRNVGNADKRRSSGSVKKRSSVNVGNVNERSASVNASR